jgi:hypothetical protein
MPLPLLVLLELAMLLIGGLGVAIGFRFYRGSGADPVAWERWYGAVGHWFRLIGPFCLWMAGVLPVIFLRPAFLPAWAPGAAALSLLLPFLVFAGATWRWEPQVGWPKGIAAWLGLLWLEPLVWSGIAMGALDFLGAELGPVRDQPLWAWYLVGLAFSRLRMVWFARLVFHARRGGGAG